jgi:hypothetical protein
MQGDKQAERRQGEKCREKTKDADRERDRETGRIHTEGQARRRVYMDFMFTAVLIG